jgi:MoaA/NifB/PqqE/SkfB family radical SAM enzyme
VRSIAFIGDGEPTCNPYLYEALSYARDHTGLDMAISTNGYLVNDREKCFDILTSCRWMRFCLSAGSREGYKKIHGKDCFEKIVENVKRMVDVKKTNAFECDIGLQAVFVPTIMKEDMIKESRLAVELGVNYFVIKQCSLPDDGESGMAGFDLKDYDKKETVELLRGCEAMSTKRTKIIVKWQTIERKGERPYDGCLSVPLISEISGNGNWFPCGYFFGDKKEYAQYKFGNIEKQRLVDIFKSKHYRDVLERMRYNFNVHSQCRGACRLDATNKFCYDYINRPEGINFI